MLSNDINILLNIQIVIVVQNLVQLIKNCTLIKTIFAVHYNCVQSEGKVQPWCLKIFDNSSEKYL